MHRIPAYVALSQFLRQASYRLSWGRSKPGKPTHPGGTVLGSCAGNLHMVFMMGLEPTLVS